MRLMIVDDDYQIREGMRLGVEWERLGIDAVDACANGVEALEIFREKMPDIILADVQMPGMTGLEMITKIREINTEVRVIFISAYSEFEYCRQALKLGADDYILKPIQFQKLEETILKNVDVIIKRRAESNLYRNALLEQEMRQIYEKRQKSGVKLCHLLKEEYSFVKEGWFLTGVACLDKEVSEGELRTFIQNVEPVIFPKKNGVVLPWNGNKMIILSKGSSSELLAIYQQTELRNKISYWNQINGERFSTISVGISKSHDLNSFDRGYEEAEKAMQYCFYRGKGSVNIYPISIRQDFSQEEEKCLIERFKKALQSSSFDKTKEEIRLWETELKKDSISPNVLKTVGWNYSLAVFCSGTGVTCRKCDFELYYGKTDCFRKKDYTA